MKRLTTLMMIFVSLMPQPSLAQIDKPKLTVQIVVDQLRGDFIDRYRHKFGPKGFNYLINHGLWYSSAFHPHARTTTCVGHATISTGTYPSFHGIVGNHWFSTDKNKSQYCVEDPNYPQLNRVTSKSSGRSPLAINSTTFSDELVLSQLGRAFGVSFKDRGAITMAGHAGHAFWFDRQQGGFTSSQYYYQQLPNWVSRYNDQQARINYSRWSLLNAPTSYAFPADGVSNKNYSNYGNTFPHHFAQQKNRRYFKTLSMSPFADEITADFAKQLISQEKIGLKGHDYLSISFSATDAIGHNFGPNSMESEDNLLRLDKTLADLFQFIDDTVGLDKTLIVLSADHGVMDNPSYLNKHHIPNGQIRLNGWLKQKLPQMLAKRFGLNQAIKAYSDPMIYLNHQAIQAQGLTVSEVSQFIITQLNALPGLYKAIDLQALLNNEIKADVITNKIAKMLHDTRTGDIYLVPKAYWTLVKGNNPDRVSHGTPWNYDAYVPMIFAHKNFQPQRITRLTETVDIAPSLAALMHIKPPSASTGQVLAEVMN